MQITKEQRAEIEAVLADADEVYLRIEEHQGWLYAWNDATDEFMTQGATVVELFDRLYEVAERISNNHVVFRIKKDEGGEILRNRSLTERSDDVIFDDEKGE